MGLIQNIIILLLLFGPALECHKFLILFNKETIDSFEFTRYLGETFTNISGIPYGFNSYTPNYINPISKEHRMPTNTTALWNYYHMLSVFVHLYFFIDSHSRKEKSFSLEIFVLLSQFIFFYGVFGNRINFLHYDQIIAEKINIGAMALLFFFNFLRLTKLNDGKWINVLYLFFFTFTANLASFITISTLFNAFVY